MDLPDLRTRPRSFACWLRQSATLMLTSLLRRASIPYVPPTMFITIPRAQIRLESADTKSEPNLQSLSIVKAIDLICHLWQQYVNIALLPLASSSVTIRREMVMFNNQTVNRMENGANTLLQRIVDGMALPILPSEKLIPVTLSDHQLAVSAIDEAETE